MSKDGPSRSCLSVFRHKSAGPGNSDHQRGCSGISQIELFVCQQGSGVCLSLGYQTLNQQSAHMFGHWSLRTLTKYKVSSHPRLFPGVPTSSPIKQDTTHKQTKTLPPPRPHLLRRKTLSWPMEKLSDSKGL